MSKEERQKSIGPEEDIQNRLRPPMSEGGEEDNQRPEEDRQNRLRPPMSERGEQENKMA